MSKKFSGPIEQDPAIVNLLERMPQSVQASFTEEQLSHLRNAVSSRQWGHHSMDIRGTIPWFTIADQSLYKCLPAGWLYDIFSTNWHIANLPI